MPQINQRTILAEMLANELGRDITPAFMNRVDVILMRLALEGFAVLPLPAEDAQA